MTQSAYLVTFTYDVSAKIVLTRLLTLLNQSRASRGLPEFLSSRVGLGRITAQSGPVELELVSFASASPPQVTLCLTAPSDSSGVSQLELALLTHSLVQTQPVELIDWPLNRARLSATAFSQALTQVVSDAVDLVEIDDGASGVTVEALFRKHFQPPAIAPRQTERRGAAKRPPRPKAQPRADYLGSILSNVEEGPVTAANKAVAGLEERTAPYRLAAWALSFIVALFCWPLALPLFANHLRNGENMRLSALAIALAGVFVAFGWAGT